VKIRPLKLKYEPTPDNAPLFARDVVASTARITGDVLDYSVDSLVVVDRILQSMRAKGVSAEQFAETLFSFGCYVGEVFVRHAGGRWIQTPEQWLAATGMRVCIELPGQKRLCNPIAKTFKRLENGEADSLAFFYAAFSRPTAPPKQPLPEAGGA
jgi:hypothetical protein